MPAVTVAAMAAAPQIACLCHGPPMRGGLHCKNRADDHAQGNECVCGQEYGAGDAGAAGGLGWLAEEITAMPSRNWAVRPMTWWRARCRILSWPAWVAPSAMSSLFVLVLSAVTAACRRARP